MTELAEPVDIDARVAFAREAPQLPSAPPSDEAVCPPLPDGLARGKRCMPKLDLEAWKLTGHPELRPILATSIPPQENWRDFDPLPSADVIVMTWTSDEWDALHYVFSNELHELPEDPEDNDDWRAKWRPYRRDMYRVYLDLRAAQSTHRGMGAPSLSRGVERWGSYTLVTVGDKTVLLFKSDMHLNQDGEGFPVATMIRRMVLEARPQLVLSIGTGGGLDKQEQILGDAVVTNAAKFRLNTEFSNAAFNDREYRSIYDPPEVSKDWADPLIMRVPEYPVHPLTAAKLNGAEPLRPSPDGRKPRVNIDDRPILTTDFFEFGTTENKLEEQGCVCEMGDAVVGMVIDELNAQAELQGPQVRYGFVRNVSDPVMNARLPSALQSAWAVTTYYRRGVLTSYNGAVATWALIAAEANGGVS